MLPQSSNKPSTILLLASTTLKSIQPELKDKNDPHQVSVVVLYNLVGSVGHWFIWLLKMHGSKLLECYKKVSLKGVCQFTPERGIFSGEKP